MMRIRNEVGKSGTQARQPLRPLLPKLLYIGEVPAEPTVGGAALLYRLLQTYPPHQLLVVQCEQNQTAIDRRLPGVRYEIYRLPFERLTRTRLNTVCGIVRYVTASWRARKVAGLSSEFDAERVLTIAHGYGWITAAIFALRKGLPLHLVVHDHVPDTMHLPTFLKRFAWRRFKTTYQQAASRWCISPRMGEAYSHLGAPARVMYPLRALDCAEFDSPPDRLYRQHTGLNYGYAGSLDTKANVDLLATLAQVVEPLGSKLVLYAGPNPPASLSSHRNVVSRGYLPSTQLVQALREEVDVLVLPMSFAPRDQQSTELSFPSKLTDYTCACLPILIWGPPSCSAVRWAKSNPGAAELVEDNSRDALAAAVDRLSSEPGWRVSLAHGAAAAGRASFDRINIVREFLQVISLTDSTRTASKDCAT
jgi:glycosyltransferase involved in cell wall biosynthesis